MNGRCKRLGRRAWIQNALRGLSGVRLRFFVCQLLVALGDNGELLLAPFLVSSLGQHLRVVDFHGSLRFRTNDCASLTTKRHVPSFFAAARLKRRRKSVLCTGNPP